MKTPAVTILGGGLSGMATAWALARAGIDDVTIVERHSQLGGLAGSFERDGHFYPLGYHHILHRDRTLLGFLDHLSVLPDVRWRRIRMLFELHGRLYNLADPLDFARFPMSLADKLRFARLMFKANRKSNWDDWLDRSGADLIDSWAGPGVREVLFERLSRLKFDLPAAEISGAWLGARLHFREGSAPLGYTPHANWTKALCDRLEAKLRDLGIHIQVNAQVTKLHTRGDQLVAAELESGERIPGDVFVSTVPTEVYLSIVHDETSALADVHYSALLSAVCATRQTVSPDFYWMNLATLDKQAGGIFLLSSLNPTIGAAGDTCVNFVTHLPSRRHELFARSDDQLIAGYMNDFRAVFRFDLEPFWHNIARVRMYSPVFDRGYRNPPAQSQSYRNVFFAGNYRNFPSIASTGTALDSGLDAATRVAATLGIELDQVATDVRRFRLRTMPRG